MEIQSHPMFFARQTFARSPGHLLPLLDSVCKVQRLDDMPQMRAFGECRLVLIPCSQPSDKPPRCCSTAHGNRRCDIVVKHCLSTILNPLKVVCRIIYQHFAPTQLKPYEKHKSELIPCHTSAWFTYVVSRYPRTGHNQTKH
jgi:hypothetical protein